MERIYLDHAATTPARPEAIAAMLPLLGEGGFNPSSLYGEGRAARAALDDARATVARILSAKPREIVFTGSGSESNVLAICGAARAAAGRGKHIISTAIEHHAVLHALDVLADDGWSVTLLSVDADGRISPDDFAAALRPDTTLATVMLANNEIGTVQPVARIAALARDRGVIVHTDATQCPGLLPFDPNELGVDLLTISAHKFYGPKGVGALYVRTGTPLRPLIVGGPQEHGLRAGTENVAGIAGLAAALALAEAERPATAAAVAGLRDRLERGLLASVADARINGLGALRLANNCSVAFAGVSSDALLIRLDLEGIAASAGSACAAGSLERSHVVAALGLPDAYKRGVIRFSLGRSTTRAQIDRVVGMLPELVSTNRGNVSPV